MSEYSEKLKDPRWQKKRLLIFERDNWMCQHCSDRESPLVVHHKFYLPNLEPWDYPDDLLTTLCENCHQIERDEGPPAEQRLLRSLRCHFFAEDVDRIASGIEKFYPLHASEVVATAYSEAFALPDVQTMLLDQMFERLREKVRQKEE